MKSSRQMKILELIRSHEIGTQEELAAYLNKEGFQVTQATVSRDIRELKLTKIVKKEGMPACYAILRPELPKLSEKYHRVFKDAFISADTAQNILVVKTVSGMAMAVAAALDDMKWPEMAGCIAGDDTIMCAIRSNEEALLMKTRLLSMAGHGENE